MSTTTCLNMIVKNEAPVIKRCLLSVKDWIDYWVIVDTGSRDGTQELILETLKGIPGELHEREWVNFGHNRNEAMNLAREKADYLFFIDADEKFVPEQGFSWNLVEKSYCLLSCEDENGISFYKAFLVRNEPHFYWYGAIHEVIASTRKYEKGQLIPYAKLLYLRGGARSLDPESPIKDLEMLLSAARENPEDPYTQFYLGMTLRKLKRYPEAIEAFCRRINIPDLSQQVFYSYLMIANMQEEMGMDCFLETVGKAHQLEPLRPEPLYLIGRDLMGKEKPEEAYFLLRPFIQSYVYEKIGYQIFYSKKAAEVLVPVLYAEACHRLGKKQEGKETLLKAMYRLGVSISDRKMFQMLLERHFSE